MRLLALVARVRLALVIKWTFAIRAISTIATFTTIIIILAKLPVSWVFAVLIIRLRISYARFISCKPNINLRARSSRPRRRCTWCLSSRLRLISKWIDARLITVPPAYSLS
jgi:hypothetical protein